MTIFMILSFVRWSGDPTFHFVAGIACTLFFAVHVFIHRKWLKATTKVCFSGKANQTLIGKYCIDILLLLIWTICIVTGFLAIGSFVGDSEIMVIFGRIHGITARIGLALVIIHIVQHRVQIKSYFGNKKRNSAEKGDNNTKSKNIAKKILGIVFHIVLHIISVHLAVAFTIFHIFQHAAHKRKLNMENL